MQEWLDNNDILMYWTHNEGTSIVAERVIKTLKGKNYLKQITSNDRKSHLSYLNKLVNENSNTCHCSIGKNPIDTNYSALTKKPE